MTEGRRIYPTHRCFDDALDNLALMIPQDPLDETKLHLVHALCQAPDGGLYAHAWVEWTDGRGVIRCLWNGILDGEYMTFAAEQGEFYAETKVKETTRYTAAQAMLENAGTDSFGPWEERYLAYCGGSREWVGFEAQLATPLVGFEEQMEKGL